MLNTVDRGAQTVSRQVLLVANTEYLSGTVLTSVGAPVSLLADTGRPMINLGQVFQAGCSADSAFIVNLPVTRKSATLCGITDWYMGVYKESWANSENPMIPYVNATMYTSTMSLVSPGRSVRINHPNYIKTVSPSGLVSVTQGPPIPGEGFYACYNLGACVAPDLCQCTQGWGGYDCNVPQCQYTDVYLNAISGCSHGGICMDVNVCYCPTVESLLYQAHPEMPKGAMTGWTARDCTMAMCTQGYADSTCKNVPPGPGGVSSMGQGCYKCWNNGEGRRSVKLSAAYAVRVVMPRRRGVRCQSASASALGDPAADDVAAPLFPGPSPLAGTCTAPDYCACPDAWQGYDCKTPVCVTHVDRTTIFNLVDLIDTSATSKTVDPALVTAFEYDPCGMSVRVPDGQGNLVSRGNCTRPNTCTCFCRVRAFKNADGRWSDEPWQDSLGRSLAPGFIYGRYSCIDGYEGNLNPDGTFSTCHLAIFVPSFLTRNTVTILIASLSSGIGFIIFVLITRRQLKLRATQIKTDRRRTRRMEEAEAKEVERMSKKKTRNA